MFASQWSIEQSLHTFDWRSLAADRDMSRRPEPLPPHAARAGLPRMAGLRLWGSTRRSAILASISSWRLPPATTSAIATSQGSQASANGKGRSAWTPTRPRSTRLDPTSFGSLWERALGRGSSEPRSDDHVDHGRAPGIGTGQSALRRAVDSMHQWHSRARAHSGAAAHDGRRSRTRPLLIHPLLACDRTRSRAAERKGTVSSQGERQRTLGVLSALRSPWSVFEGPRIG